MAGFGTEVLRAAKPLKVDIRGSVSEKGLRDLLVGCRALVIRQVQTSGFLTRIVEANLCDIPVMILGQYEQAMGMEDYGVNFIQTIDDLNGLSVSRFRHFEKPDATPAAQHG